MYFYYNFLCFRSFLSFFICFSSTVVNVVYVCICARALTKTKAMQTHTHTERWKIYRSFQRSSNKPPSLNSIVKKRIIKMKIIIVIIRSIVDICMCVYAFGFEFEIFVEMMLSHRNIPALIWHDNDFDADGYSIAILMYHSPLLCLHIHPFTLFSLVSLTLFVMWLLSFAVYCVRKF